MKIQQSIVIAISLIAISAAADAGKNSATASSDAAAAPAAVSAVPGEADVPLPFTEAPDLTKPGTIRGKNKMNRPGQAASGTTSVRDLKETKSSSRQ